MRFPNTSTFPQQLRGCTFATTVVECTATQQSLGSGVFFEYRLCRVCYNICSYPFSFPLGTDQLKTGILFCISFLDLVICAVVCIKIFLKVIHWHRVMLMMKVNKAIFRNVMVCDLHLKSTQYQKLCLGKSTLCFSNGQGKKITVTKTNKQQRLDILSQSE